MHIGKILQKVHAKTNKIRYNGPKWSIGVIKRDSKYGFYVLVITAREVDCRLIDCNTVDYRLPED